MWYIGFQNFATIFQDSRFWESFRIPLFLLLVQVPLMIFIATLIAFSYERLQKKRWRFLSLCLLPSLHDTWDCHWYYLVLYFLRWHVSFLTSNPDLWVIPELKF